MDDSPQPAMLLEAAILLACTRILQRFCFRMVAPWMMRPRPAEDPNPPHDLARRIGNSIESAARNVPWTSLCLVNAMAAKLMLERRGYSSTIHLGVNTGTGTLEAHAWLEAGTIVTGEPGIHAMTPIPR